MKHFLVIYTYSANTGARDEIRPSHRQWLAEQFEAGLLLSSGPFTEQDGAVLIWQSESEAALKALLEDDPFAEYGLIIKTELTEWTPVFGPWA